MKGKLGLRAQDTAELALDGVRVPDSARLGEEGQGFKVAMSALDNGRISLAAGCVGIAQGCLDACVAYAGERRAFGKPVAGFQLVQQLLAEMHVETEAARLLTWKAAALADAGRPYTTEAAVAKWYASEAAVRAANAAVQVLGGYGYVDEYPVAKYLRDARVTTLYEGTSQIQTLIVGRALDRRKRLYVRRGRMPEAVIVAAARTPIGRAAKGSLADVRPDDLLAFAISEAVAQVPELDTNEIVDVMVGCGFPQEKQGMNLARRAALLAGLPKRVPGTTVNRFCASSLQTARMAFHAIKSGEGDVYVAAGVESISQVDGYPKDTDELHPKLVGEGAIANVYIPMGMTAENVADQYDVSRQDMDRYAQQSQERAVAAQESGFFARELSPYTKEDGTVVSADDGPRPSSTLEKLAELQPAFRPDGRVTAGNSCPLNDGAAALVITSEERAAEFGLKPRARIVSTAVTGLDPEIMGVGPIDAIRVALGRAGMTIDDVDVMELNEAFAAQVIPVCREVGVDPFSDKLNPHGGAIALGHPYGMTGARIMCTLLNDLETLDRTVGLETMCVGGGQGMAMVVERLS